MMLEIVLGSLATIGIFVFWFDVTDSWNGVSRRIRSGPTSRNEWSSRRTTAKPEMGRLG